MKTSTVVMIAAACALCAMSCSTIVLLFWDKVRGMLGMGGAAVGTDTTGTTGAQTGAITTPGIALPPTLPGNPSPAVNLEGVVRGSGATATGGGGACPAGAALLPQFQAKAVERVGRAKGGPYALALYGDSITEQIEPDAALLQRMTASLGGPIGMFGIAGDLVTGVLWRVCNGGLANAKVYHVLIGTNDLSLGRPPAEVATHTLQLVQYIRAKQPASHVIVMGIMWRSTMWDKAQAVNAAVRAGIQKMDAKCHWVDWGTKLTNADHSDGLHPLPTTWHRLMDRLVPYVKTLTS